MQVPAELKQLIGKSLGPIDVEVEKGQIRRFARAIGEEHLIHHVEAAAEAQGFASLVAPPTFPAALCSIAELLDSLGLDAQSIMHAEEEYEYFRPICAGDKLRVVHRVADAYNKDGAGGHLKFVVVETRATDDAARTVFKGRRVLVERKV